jgi:hypothetical protein
MNPPGPEWLSAQAAQNFRAGTPTDRPGGSRRGGYPPPGPARLSALRVDNFSAKAKGPGVRRWAIDMYSSRPGGDVSRDSGREKGMSASPGANELSAQTAERFRAGARPLPIGE